MIPESDRLRTLVRSLAGRLLLNSYRRPLKGFNDRPSPKTNDLRLARSRSNTAEQDNGNPAIYLLQGRANSQGAGGHEFCYNLRSPQTAREAHCLIHKMVIVPSIYPLLDPTCPLVGTMHPCLRVAVAELLVLCTITITIVQLSTIICYYLLLYTINILSYNYIPLYYIRLPLIL